MAEKLDEIIDQASRLMSAGWRGNPHMSGDDRNFMSPSMRRRHDDKARTVVEFILQALRPGSTGETEGWRDIKSDPPPMDGRMAIVYRPLARLTQDEPVALKRLLGGHQGCWERTVPPGDEPYNPTDGSCHVTHWRPLPEPPTAGGTE